MRMRFTRRVKKVMAHAKLYAFAQLGTLLGSLMLVASMGKLAVIIFRHNLSTLNTLQGISNPMSMTVVSIAIIMIAAVIKQKIQRY